VIERSIAEGRPDRERAARDKLIALQGVRPEAGESEVSVPSADVPQKSEQPPAAEESSEPPAPSEQNTPIEVEEVAKPVSRAHPAAQKVSSAGWSTMQWVGLSTAAAGVVGLGLGTVFVLSAVDKNTESSLQCSLDVCTAQGRDARRDAIQYGDAATFAMALGGGLVATGLALLVLGSGSSATETTATPELRASLLLEPRELGANLEGTF
jgi:hypothetical protein